MPGNQGPNGVGDTCNADGCTTFTAFNYTSNGFFPNGRIAPYAWHTLRIKICNCKVVSVTGAHTRYPNLEIWVYGCGSPIKAYTYDKNTTGSGPSNINDSPISVGR